MLPQSLIRKKRDGDALSTEELQFFISGIVDQSIPDYQVSAFLMAVYFKGLNPEEMSAWTEAMLFSGDVLDLSSIDRPKIDKHSTGGVGDKISLPLAPAVAACGVAVPMVSGRGLGHTGGTLDKLESIPGFNVNLSIETFRKQTDELGVCLIGQTKDIAPADKRLYALRDVTATVESIPLIASSIMSKKLAEGIDALVLDCKVGHGAFFPDMERAKALAFAIQAIGTSRGKPVTAVITDMNAPIGWAIGNALEVKESIETLRGEGPVDTHELTVTLGAEMLLLAKVETDVDVARNRIDKVLKDGSALAIFQKVIEAQGGDPKVCDDLSRLPKTNKTIAVTAKQSGTVIDIEARHIGVAGLHLGAGRIRAEDSINPAVGIEMKVKPGSSVSVGDILAILHVGDHGVDEASRLVRQSIVVGDGAVSNTTKTRILEIHR